MKNLRQAQWRAALGAAGLMLVLPAVAQNATNAPPPVKLLSAPRTPTPPLPQQPVNFFRQLLAMTPQAREKNLVIYPPAIRVRILAKVREYLAMDPNERELRLRATELRWYLLPLLREAPTNRAARLASVPDDLRGLVNARLAKWDALPPQSRKEFLDNEQALDYFSHLDPANAASAPGGLRAPSSSAQARWNALSEGERRKITAQFNQFFDLTPAEKQKALNTLSNAERIQMQKTLQTFSHLPPAQRAQCIRAYTEFASMSLQEREQFLKNAARWSQMTPQQRQAWRDLVAQVPLWPPVPVRFTPPPKPPLPSPPRGHALAATNHF